MRTAMTLSLSAAIASAQGWVQRAPFSAPPARTGHAMTQDAVREVAVLFGGTSAAATETADTWEYNGFGWLPRFPFAAPPARAGHGLVFDTRRARSVLFGGRTSSGTGSAFADTWEWDGVAWTQRLLPNTPPARSHFGMAFDTWRGCAVVFGGRGAGGQQLGDTWTFDGVNWTQVSSTTSPSARSSVAMTFDDARGNVLLFGGGDGTQVLADTWTFDGAQWTQLAPSLSPSARQEARLVHDLRCGHAVLHGGSDLSLSVAFADSWMFDGVTWSPVVGATPPGRHGAALANDAARGQVTLWGGTGAVGQLADTWQRPSPCSRTMSVPQPPVITQPARFRYSYPASAAGHLGIHLLTLRQNGGFAVPIPGFLSVGQCYVDLFRIEVQALAVLDASGASDFVVQMPADPYLVGLPFDVQSVDLAVPSSTLIWADGDAEVAIAPLPPPPVANFTATPTMGPLPLVVQFTDTSTGSPTSWQWDFEDDGVIDSTLQNPIATYTTAGFRSVRLVVSNAGGTNARRKADLVYAGAAAPPSLLDMVQIPSGSFAMGSSITPLNAQPHFNRANAQPVHTVTITRPFWMGRTEVTQAQYAAVMGTNPSRFVGLQRPVERVDWTSAMAYCAALTVAESAAGRIPAGYQYRLPTEAEWEYCCRAGTTTEFSFGGTIVCGQANFSANEYDGSSCNLGATASVGTYPANAFGLRDMHGNVLEWCLDAWDLATGYSAAAVADPYVTTGTNRITRGGYWSSSASQCRSATRNGSLVNTQPDYQGFRVVLAHVLVP